MTGAERTEMLKVVVWDFDGVIFDSMHLKCEGFKALFKRAGCADEGALRVFETYHYENGGISRFDKIDHFYRHILKQPLEAPQIDALVLDYGHIISKNLFCKDHLNVEVLDFIQKHHKQYTFHIASAALHNELQILCAFLGLKPYFRSIEGSPPSKAKVLAKLIQNYGYRSDEMLLIGDSKSDYESALANHIAFLGYNSSMLKSLVGQEGYRGGYIESFKGLDLDVLFGSDQS